MVAQYSRTEIRRMVVLSARRAQFEVARPGIRWVACGYRLEQDKEKPARERRHAATRT